MSVDKIFEALSSAPRRRILAYLSKTDMTAGEIAQRFSARMSQPAISMHLSVLENAGRVWRESGQNVRYRLEEDALTSTLVHFLAEVCPRSRPFREDRRGRQAQESARSKHSGERVSERVKAWRRDISPAPSNGGVQKVEMQIDIARACRAPDAARRHSTARSAWHRSTPTSDAAVAQRSRVERRPMVGGRMVALHDPAQAAKPLACRLRRDGGNCRRRLSAGAL